MIPMMKLIVLLPGDSWAKTKDMTKRFGFEGW